MKYEVKFTNQFKKDLKLAKKQNKNTDEVLVLMLYDLVRIQNCLRNKITHF